MITTKTIEHHVDDEIKQCFSLAKQGVAEKQYELAVRYAHGHGIEKSAQQSFIWLQESAKNGYAKAQCWLGSLFEKGDHYLDVDIEKAFYWYQQAANQNNAQAEYRLGVHYYIGIHIKKNISTALYWLKRSAQHHYSKATLKIGDIFLSDNVDEAIYWYEQAAYAGNHEACLRLITLYKEGSERDNALAFKWLQFAAEQGNAKAAIEIANLYVENNTLEDDKKAVAYLRIAIEQLDYSAHFQLAKLFLTKRGFDIENKEEIQHAQQEAILLLQKAAEANFIPAQLQLATWYRQDKQIELAIEWYKMLAQSHHPEGLFYLAFLLNLSNAREEVILGYYYQSALQNYIPAQIALGDFFLEKDNHSKAFQWYESAAEGNEVEAQMTVARLSSVGCYPIKQDLTKSAYWFSRIILSQNNYSYPCSNSLLELKAAHPDNVAILFYFFIILGAPSTNDINKLNSIAAAKQTWLSKKINYSDALFKQKQFDKLYRQESKELKERIHKWLQPQIKTDLIARTQRYFADKYQHMFDGIQKSSSHFHQGLFHLMKLICSYDSEFTEHNYLVTFSPEDGEKHLYALRKSFRDLIIAELNNTTYSTEEKRALETISQQIEKIIIDPIVSLEELIQCVNDEINSLKKRKMKSPLILIFNQTLKNSIPSFIVESVMLKLKNQASTSSTRRLTLSI